MKTDGKLIKNLVKPEIYNVFDNHVVVIYWLFNGHCLIFFSFLTLKYFTLNLLSEFCFGKIPFSANCPLQCKLTRSGQTYPNT